MQSDQRHQSTSRDTLDDALSLEDVRLKVQRAKSTRASLRAEVDRLRAVPTQDAVAAARQAAVRRLPEHIAELSAAVNESEDRCILHRTTGWTVFEIDIDIGRRERRDRRALKRHPCRFPACKAIDRRFTRSNDVLRHIREVHHNATPPSSEEEDPIDDDPAFLDKTALGLGVRIDTFFRGRFYEPYYLVFGKKGQLLKNDAPVTGSAMDAAMPTRDDANSSGDEEEKESNVRDGRQSVRLLRHTIPQFVPLEALVERYLGSGSVVDADRRGGLDLLDGLLSRDGLWSFLGILHTHLQAFVSRREQAIVLQKLELPGLSPSALEAFGNDAFDQISVRWTLHPPLLQDILDYERHASINRAQYESHPEQLRQIMQKREKAEARAKKMGAPAMVFVLKITLHITDLTSDRLGRPLPKPAKFKGDDLPCEYGSVLIETIGPKLCYSSAYVPDKPSRMRYKRDRREDFEETMAEDGDLDVLVARLMQQYFGERVAQASKDELTFTGGR